MPNPKYDWIVRDYTYKYKGRMADLISEMDADGWELVTAFGESGFISQQHVPAKLIFRRLK